MPRGPTAAVTRLDARSTPAAKNSTAKPPMTRSSGVSGVNPGGSRNIHNAVAMKVSASAATAARMEPLMTASAMASRSTSSTQGQSDHDTESSLKNGPSISRSASAGKSWFHQLAGRPGRRRSSSSGNEV